jgi:hypothetical protein
MYLTVAAYSTCVFTRTRAPILNFATSAARADLDTSKPIEDEHRALKFGDFVRLDYRRHHLYNAFCDAHINLLYLLGNMFDRRF